MSNREASGSAGPYRGTFADAIRSGPRYEIPALLHHFQVFLDTVTATRFSGQPMRAERILAGAVVVAGLGLTMNPSDHPIGGSKTANAIDFATGFGAANLKTFPMAVTASALGLSDQVRNRYLKQPLSAWQQVNDAFLSDVHPNRRFAPQDLPHLGAWLEATLRSSERLLIPIDGRLNQSRRSLTALQDLLWVAAATRRAIPADRSLVCQAVWDWCGAYLDSWPRDCERAWNVVAAEIDDPTTSLAEANGDLSAMTSDMRGWGEALAARQNGLDLGLQGALSSSVFFGRTNQAPISIADLCFAAVLASLPSNVGEGPVRAIQAAFDRVFTPHGLSVETRYFVSRTASPEGSGVDYLERWSSEFAVVHPAQVALPRSLMNVLACTWAIAQPTASPSPRLRETYMTLATLASAN